MTSKTAATRVLPSLAALTLASMVAVAATTCAPHARAQQPAPDPLSYSAPPPMAGSPAALAPQAEYEGGLTGLAKDTTKAIDSKNWKLLAILISVGAVWLIRRYGSKIPGKVGAFLGTDAGGIATAGAWALVLTLSAYGLAGKPLSLQVLLDALQLALPAMGASNAKKLLPKKTEPEPAPAAPPGA